MRIFLTGFMGSGKTTVGKLLAADLEVAFLDSDEEIEKQTGKTVAEIFASEGEAYFRSLEENFINELTLQKCVISCGGGLPVCNDLIEIIKVKGTVIYLETRAEELYRRLKNESESRPLLSKDLSIEELAEKMSEREKFYAKAHFTVSTDGLKPEEVAGKIRKLL